MLHSGGVLTQRSLLPSLLELINNLCKFSQSSSFPTSSTPLTKIMKLATICVNRLGQYELQSFALVLTGASHKALCVPSYVVAAEGKMGKERSMRMKLPSYALAGLLPWSFLKSIQG